MFDGCLTMSLHGLSFSSNSFCHFNANNSLDKLRLKTVQAVTPSSIQLGTDESGNFPESKKGRGLKSSSFSHPLLSQANTVGIIGGTTVDSTLNFLQKLDQWSEKDGLDGIPFILCSDPILNKKLLFHERNSWPSISRQNECPTLDHTPIVENLRSKRIFLEKSGARCIVMPCHISHSWYDEVSKGCSVKILHIGECVARELKEAKFRPLEAGSPLRIGLLASNATLTAGFFQEKLQNEGFEVVLPDKATMDHTVIPAIEALNRNDMEGAQNLLRIALQVLLVRAVNTVILASNDMRDLLPCNDPLLKKCVDPMDALARATIKWAKSAGKGR